MAVIGVGIDLVETGRIEDSLSRFGKRFLQRVFTEGEQRYALAKRRPSESLAARFAAKEAAAKALGTGISRGVGWQDIEVTRAPGHAPQLVLHGRALDWAAKLGVRRASLALSHTEHYATAIVILESEILRSEPISEVSVSGRQ